MGCPRCSAPLATGFGVLGEDVCASCAGRFLGTDAAERLIVDENGISRQTLRELIPLFSSRERLTCPSCSMRMSPVVVRGVRVDLCTGCGGVWLDRGELAKLGDGRYEEVTPAGPVDEPPAPPAPVSEPVRRCAVFLHSLDPLDVHAVSAAFARCPGLVEHDALALARNNNGVVVDGVGAETAALIAGALRREGIEASPADETWTSLVSPVQAQSFAVTPSGIRFGRGADAPLVPWGSVACAAAGVVRRTSLRPAAGRDARALGPLEPELVVVEGDDPTLEVFALDPVRRWRVPLSLLLFGDEGRGRDRLELFCERVGQLGRLLPAGVGRGVRACAEGRPLPRYRSLRDLEREEAWLLWRHHGPGAP